MNKTEIKKEINKRVYRFAESLGYEIQDFGDGACVQMCKRNEKDFIEYHRSSYDVCVTNWSSTRLKADAKRIEQFIKNITPTIK
jgi:hypothetical protein